MPVTSKGEHAFQSAPHAEFERGGKTLNILFDCISSCIFSQRDFAFNWMCCTQALCSLTNIFPLAMSQPTGGLVLNPSLQIQLLDSPRGGRGAAIPTKGIIDIIKLSVYSRKKCFCIINKCTVSNPYKPSVGYNLAHNDESDLALESWVGRFY